MVANRTADSPDLIAALRRRAERSPTSFTLLVPAVPHGLAWAADMKAGWSEAVERAERAAAPDPAGRTRAWRTTIVGDPDPFAAVGDVLHARSSTRSSSRCCRGHLHSWLALGLPHPAAANHRPPGPPR